MRRKLATKQGVTYVAPQEFNTEKVDNILNLLLFPVKSRIFEPF